MLLGIIVVIVVAWLANRAVQDVRSRATAGPRTKGMRARASAPRPVTSGRVVPAARSAGRAVSTVIALPAALVTGFTEQSRHHRANGKPPANSAAVAATPKPKLRQRLLAPFTPDPPDPGSGGSSGTSACRCNRPLAAGKCWACGEDPAKCTCTPMSTSPSGNGQPAPAAPAANGGTVNRRPGYPYPHDPDPPEDRAAQQRAAAYQAQQNETQPAQQASSNGGTTVSGASTAAAQKMIEGINEIAAHAASGGIHAKREALAAAHEGATRYAGMVQMLARQMSEPGMNYGPEITEPLAKAGQHFNAGAMTAAEADSALEALLNMTVGDLAKSPRQAPHHRELTENGSR